jgi:serine/threonine protein kinase
MSILLKSELLILEKTHHPNIVRLFDLFYDDYCFYLVQALCLGGELEDEKDVLRLDDKMKYRPKFQEKHCA